VSSPVATSLAATAMSTLVHDLRIAVRSLRRTPGFSITAILTLALGIGANTAIFSVVDGVLLNPLPVADGDRVVVVGEKNVERGWYGAGIAGPSFAAWREGSRSLEAVGAYSTRNVDITGVAEPIEADGALVSRELFDIVSVRPVLGRLFRPDEFVTGAEPAPVMLLSEPFWRTRFGADPSVLGRAIVVNDRARTIVGVVPVREGVPAQADVYFAFPENFASLPAGGHMLTVVGRLRPGITPDRARAELTEIVGRLDASKRDRETGWQFEVERLTNVVVRDARPQLGVLLGAVSFVLLIVCANITSLLLARASARSHELAIRRALGASRLRLAAHLVAEAVVVAAFGGALALVVASWGVDFLRGAGPMALPRLSEVGFDQSVLLFNLGVSVVAGLLSGAIPAVRAARAVPNAVLNDGGRGSAPRRGRSVRDAIVVAEIALALVLLTGAGLMVRSLLRLTAIPLGFDRHNVLAVDLDLPERRYREPASRAALVSRVEERLRALPGVVAVGSTRALPLESGGPDAGFEIVGRPPVPQGELGPAAFYTAVSAGYLNALGVPVRRGRGLTDADDRTDARRVVVINETLARRYWADANPVGAEIVLDGQRTEIVGVVADIRQRWLRNEVAPAIYVPYAQAPQLQVSVVVRAAVDPTSLVKAIHEAVWTVDPSLPVEQWTMDSLLADHLAGSRFQTTLLAGFAAFAVLLAVMGVYAVVSFSVAQRTREIGVRVALGAAERDVLRLVVGHGATLAAIGIGLGMVGSFWLTRMLANVLYEVSATDPASFALAAGLLATAALAATYLPARRAARVDPAIALRNE
jgi:putative ABC transport system permease protein